MSLLSLPNDVLSIIVSNLYVPNILRLRLTCKVMNNFILTRNKFWFVQFCYIKYHGTIPKLLKYIEQNENSQKCHKYKRIIKAITIRNCGIKNKIYEQTLRIPLKIPPLRCIYPDFIELTTENSEIYEKMVKNITSLTINHPEYETWRTYIFNLLKDLITHNDKVLNDYIIGYCRYKYCIEKYPDFVCLYNDHYEINIKTQMNCIDILDEKLLTIYDPNLNYFEKYLYRILKNKFVNKFSSIPQPKFFDKKIRSLQVELEDIQKKLSDEEKLHNISLFLQKTKSKR